jgi:hypothetical protein
VKPVLPAALRPGRKNKPKTSLPRNSGTPVLLSYPAKHTDPVEIVHCKVFSQAGLRILSKPHHPASVTINGATVTTGLPMLASSSITGTNPQAKPGSLHYG